MKPATTKTLPRHGVAVLLAALGACTLPTGGPQNTYSGGAGKLEMQRIEGDKALAASLKIVNPIAKMVDGRQVAQFELTSTTPGPQRFVWAVNWFDADGFLIDSEHVFEPLTLGGYGSKPLKIVAPRAGEGLTWKLVLARPDEIR